MLKTRGEMDMTRSQFIGGQLVSGRSTRAIDVYNPATGQVIAEANAAPPEDVDTAVAAAKQAHERGEWRSTNIHDRANTLWQLGDRIMARANELAELEVRDNGMPLPLAKAMIGSAIGSLRYYAGMITKIHGFATDLSGPGH